MRHLGGINDLSKCDIESLLDRAEELRSGARPAKAPGRVLTLAFFQPSTRTRVGFAAAGVRLGYGTIDLWGERFDAAMSEPESLADTIRVVSAYSDMMILRHATAEGWQTAVRSSRCPLVNGGNGPGEHPTQALIDLLAIRSARGSLDGLRIGIVGDIRHSRSVHSLVKALSLFRPVFVRFMGPAPCIDSVLAADWSGSLDARCVVVSTEVALADLDVLYMAGLPRGAAADSKDRAAYALTAERVVTLPREAVVLCPLPRIDEIATDVDVDARARYFQQSDDGMWVRMAVIERMAAMSE